MKGLVGHTAALALGLALATSPAIAQLNSIPVYFDPNAGTGFTFGLDFGTGIKTESGKNTAFGARASVGGGPIRIGVGVGTVNPRVSATQRASELQYMGSLAMRVFGGPLLPVSITAQLGVGFQTQDIVVGPATIEQKSVNIPIGIGIGFSAPTPGFSFDPWIAPRVQFSTTEIGADKPARVGLGVSGGINLKFVMGLGLHLAFDVTSLPSKTSGATTLLSATPATIGIGVHYSIGPPGVPMVPGVN